MFKETKNIIVTFLSAAVVALGAWVFNINSQFLSLQNDVARHEISIDANREKFTDMKQELVAGTNDRFTGADGKDLRNHICEKIEKLSDEISNIKQRLEYERGKRGE